MKVKVTGRHLPFPLYTLFVTLQYGGGGGVDDLPASITFYDRKIKIYVDTPFSFLNF